MRSPFPPDWVLEHSARSPEAPAIASPTESCSYGELAERVRMLSLRLAGAGVRSGDRVLFVLPNVVASVVAGLAVQQLGACVVQANRQWDAETLADIAMRTHAHHAFVSARDARTVREIARTCPMRYWVVGEGLVGRRMRETVGDDAIVLREDGVVVDAPAAPWRGVVLPSRLRRPESPALILFTSGSTGRPHGVIQTYRNIDANTRAIVAYLALTASDRAMLTLPMSYCYGRSVLHTHLLVGGSVFLDERFMYPRLVLETIGTEGCTGFAGVPLTFEIIRREVDVRGIPMPRLRYVTQAGGAMAVETIRWVRRAFAPAELFVMYGQSEATARLSYLPPGHAVAKEGSIGIPIPGVELKVVDPTGREVGPGELGEIVARGDNVTSGYLDDPEATRRILHHGWLWTGDIAYRDADGFFFHVGRSVDLFKIAGHRVSPIEIEHALERHPDVAEAGVVRGERDPGDGSLAAFIVRRAGGSVTDLELQRFCRDRLPAYKVPRTITFVDSLPRSEAGKLRRTELAALGLAAAGGAAR